MEIKKIELLNEKNELIEIPKDKLDLFFSISRFDARNPLDSLKISGLSKLFVIKNIFFALIRKVLRIKPAISERELLTSFTKRYFKKIILVKIYLNNKVITFCIKEIHLLNLLGDLRGVILNNQYNANEENIKDKIVIDAGAHNGEFSMLAVLLGAKRVYSFEPVSETVKILERNVNLSNMANKIKIIPLALGEKNEEAIINFNFIGDGAAKIGESGENKNQEKIKIIRLDEFIKKNKIKPVGFIKMDIEGFEENALKGSEKIIKRDKPVLSLSAYHKPNDTERLPQVINSIREDYKIELNNKDEKDFYCY